MALTGPHLIQGGCAVPLSDAQFAAMRGGRPIASAPRRPAPPVAAAPKAAPAPTDAETRRKADAFDARTAADARARGRASMLKTVEQKHGPAARAAAEARLAPMQPAADRVAVLPKSIKEAKGDARAFSRADMARQVAAATGEAAPGSAGASLGRKSMEALVRKMGMEPVR